MTTVLLVDDFDTTRVTYGSGWVNGGNSLREYNGTTHAMSNKGGTFSFAFNGTKVGTYGTIDQNTSSVPIECSIDGNNISVGASIAAPSSEILYQELFCEGVVSDDKEHTFTLTVTEDVSGARPLFLDYILYEIPTNSKNDVIPPHNAGVSIVVDDTATDQVSFERAWQTGGVVPELQRTTHGTTANDARAIFKFTGTKVAAYGTVDLNGDDHWTTTYQVDAGPITTLDSSTYSVTLPMHQMKFFESPSLEDGDHTLIITYTSGPLEYWLDYFTYTPSSSFGFISSASNSLSPPSSTPSPGEPSTATNTTHHSSSSLSAGPIAGIAVGGVVIISLIAVICVLLFKRPRGRDQPYHGQDATQSSTSTYAPPMGARPNSYDSQPLSRSSMAYTPFYPASQPNSQHEAAFLRNTANYQSYSSFSDPASSSAIMDGSQVSSGVYLTSERHQDAGVSLGGGPVDNDVGGRDLLPPVYTKR
jgi:hypothetical protein